MPRYGGKHAHLTEEERQQFEAEDALYLFQRCSYKLDMVKVKFHLTKQYGMGDCQKDGIPTYNLR